MSNSYREKAIARAKADVEYWEEQRQELMRESRFDRCKPAELIQIAETGADLDGVKLEGLDWAALDNAWREKFGEPYLKPKTKPREQQAGLRPKDSVPVGQHPIMAIPDDQMLRIRDVIRLFGYAKTTLKRHQKLGKFPKAQRIVPGQSYVGWPARQLKAWLREGGLIDSADATKH